MRFGRILEGALLLGIVALLGAGCGPQSQGSQGAANREAGEPKAQAPSPERERSAPDRVPDFGVTTFSGSNFRLSEQRGAPVVLNFWESW